MLYKLLTLTLAATILACPILCGVGICGADCCADPTVATAESVSCPGCCHSAVPESVPSRPANGLPFESCRCICGVAILIVAHGPESQRESESRDGFLQLPTARALVEFTHLEGQLPSRDHPPAPSADVCAWHQTFLL